MIPVYVVWRTVEDEYFVTRIEVESLERISIRDLVILAEKAEYPDTQSSIEQGAGYDLITIFSGTNIKFRF